jgi:hypothetical protein
MTLFELDFLKPPGGLLLQYDTWEVVSHGVVQTVSSRLSRKKPFQTEFRASKQCAICCKRVDVVGSNRTTVTCKGETSARVNHRRREWAVEKQGGLKPAPGTSGYFQTESH